MAPTTDLPMDLPMDRLEQALAVLLAYEGRDPNELLAAHPDLADLLAPMLQEQQADAQHGHQDQDQEQHQDQKQKQDQEQEQVQDALARPEALTLADFEIVREIGRGGMGIVHEAVQVSLRRRVALKVLPSELLAEPSAVLRFRREAEIVARLEHPGIVRVIVVGQSDGRPFYAMELIAGAPLGKMLDCLRGRDPRRLDVGSLRAALQQASHVPCQFATLRGRTWCEAVAELAYDVAVALAHAHGALVIHRDVKPANVLVRDDGSACLADFGLARITDLPGLSCTATFVGTPSYASPEQIRGPSSLVDARTDVYSLGATLYELLTLQRPFEADTTHALLQRITHDGLKDPRALNPSIPRSLGAIVQKALEKQPAQRYAGAAELAADLRAFLELRPVSARPVTMLGRFTRWVRREKVAAALWFTLGIGVPSVTALVVWQLENRELVREGAAQQQLTQVERHLVEGFSHYEAGRGVAARDAFAAALRLAPESPEAIAAQVLTCLRYETTPAALQLLEARSALVERTPALLRVRAVALAAAGRDDEAQRIRARLAPPEDGLDLLLAGMLAISGVKNSDVDQQSAEQALGLLDRAGVLLRTPNLLHHIQRVRAARYAKNTAAALVSGEALIKHWPDFAPALFWGGLAFQDHDPTRAQRAYARAIELEPGFVEARGNLATVLVNLGRPEAALRERERVVALAPDRMIGWLNLASVRLELGDRDGARQAAEKAVTLDRTSAEARTLLACVLMRAGERRDAKKQAAIALEYRPTDAPSRFNLGLLCYELDDLGGAERAWREGSELDPRFVECQVMHGVVLSDLGRLEAAVECWERALGIDPNNLRALINLGVNARQRDDVERSLVWLQRAVAADPKHQAAHAQLVKTLEQHDDAAALQREHQRFAQATADQASASQATPNRASASRASTGR